MSRDWTPEEWADADEGVKQGREHRRAIAENLARIAELEAEAVRVTSGPGGRCFEMPSGDLFTIANEQPAGSRMLHSQFILPTSKWDAADLYGWTPVSVSESGT